MDIARLDRCDHAILQHHIRTGTPAVFTNIARQWPAIGRWNPDYLAAVCGDQKVHVTYYPDTKNCAGMVGMTIRDYLREVVHTPGASDQLYLETIELKKLSPALYQDLPFQQYLNDLPDTVDFVFFGKDTGTRCHIHPHAEAVVFQMFGRKTFYLYHPSDVRYLYLEPIYREFYASRIDFRNIDHAKFPLARRARRIDVPLEAGDALYLPVHWPHWTHGSGLNFTLTRFALASVRQYYFPYPGLQCLVDRLAHGPQRS
jgi:hypothetical protein